MEYDKSISDTGEWVEGDHPRSKNGQFTSGAGEKVLKQLAKVTFSEKERENERFSKKVGGTFIDKEYIQSDAYKNKYNDVDVSEKVQNALKQKGMWMLFHRNGTDYEDMFLINRNTGKVDAGQTKMHSWGTDEAARHLGVDYSPEMYAAIRLNPRKTYLTIHNHPNNSPPSGSDFEKAFEYGYAGGIVACHDGTIYYYEVGDNSFTAGYYDKKVARRAKEIYNEKVKDHKGEDGFVHQCECVAREQIMDEVANSYGIRWWKK